MTLDELIARLAELREKHGGDLPVIYDGWRSPVNNADLLPCNARREWAAIALSE